MCRLALGSVGECGSDRLYYSSETTGWRTRVASFAEPGCGNVALYIDKSADRDPTPGSRLTYRLQFSNNGSGTAHGVTLTESVPAGTSFVPTPGWTGCNAGAEPGTECTYDVGALAAGASGEADFVVTVDPNAAALPATIANTARIESDYDGISDEAQLSLTPIIPPPTTTGPTTPPTGPTTPPTLPNTGAATASPTLAALATTLVVAGGLILAVRRRSLR